jgi:hypothetical protein
VANAIEIETHLDNATRKKHHLFLELTAKKKENSDGENRNRKTRKQSLGELISRK